MTVPPIAPPPRRRWGPVVLLAVALPAIVLIGALPLIVALTAGAIANALGCVLNEGDAHPCPFHGYDLGEVLYEMGVTGWLSLVTIPFAAILLLIWLGAVVVAIVSGQSSRRNLT